MKKAVLLLILVLLVGAVVPLAPQRVMGNGGVSMQTNAATDVDYFWATLNGQVTGFSGGCTVSEVGFVWSPVSHGDPGGTVPWETAYVYDDYGSMTEWLESHSSPFTWSYGAVGTGVGAYLRFNTRYYYRACVYEDAPYSTWAYGNEQVIDLVETPEGYWPFYGWVENSYLMMDTGTAVAFTLDAVCLRGSVTWSDPALPYYVDHLGFVWDTESHDNPSGWPDDYTDVSPETCEYPNWIEVSGETSAPYVPYSYQMYDAELGVTYYYRAVADRQSGGDWVYGPEESFTVTEDCQLEDCQLAYAEDYYGPDYICQDTWVRQDIAPWYTRTATELWIDIYRVGSPHELGVHIYPVDPDTWEPIWASEVWRDYIDVSGITEDIAGEWVELEFGETLTFDELGWYAIILEMDEDCFGSDFVVWVSQDYDYSTYYGVMGVTINAGESWDWVDRDCLFALVCCSGGMSVAGTYETWGYVPSPRPAWYQAWPSILKVLYIGAVLLAAMFTYRQKPKPQYPDMPDMPDMGDVGGMPE